MSAASPLLSHTPPPSPHPLPPYPAVNGWRRANVCEYVKHAIVPSCVRLICFFLGCEWVYCLKCDQRRSECECLASNLCSDPIILVILRPFTEWWLWNVSTSSYYRLCFLFLRWKNRWHNWLFDFHFVLPSCRGPLVGNQRCTWRSTSRLNTDDNSSQHLHYITFFPW